MFDLITGLRVIAYNFMISSKIYNADNFFDMQWVMVSFDTTWTNT